MNTYLMIDDLLLIIIIAGMGLTVVYLRAEYVLHQGFKAADQKKSLVQRALYTKRL